MGPPKAVDREFVYIDFFCSAFALAAEPPSPAPVPAPAAPYPHIRRQATVVVV